jgi:ABC-2 type transport system ATP-binding protein
MDEAQHLADRVAVMADGHIVAEGTPESLGGRDEGHAIVSFRVSGPVPAGLPAPFAGDGPTFEAEVDHPTADLHRLTAWATSTGVELENLTVARPTLEDVYLRLTGDGDE